MQPGCAGIRERLQSGLVPMDVSAWLEEVAKPMMGQPSLVRAVLLGALSGLLPNSAVRGFCPCYWHFALDAA